MPDPPLDADADLERASALCELGRWDDAATRLRTILATDPQNEQALGSLARALLGQKAYPEALRTHRGPSGSGARTS